jgi:TRAP-type mannitol/chloroaromatic compound transport system permease large subunit
VSDDHDISTSEMVKLMAWASNNKNLMLPIPVSFFKFTGKLLNKNDIIDRLTGSLELDIQHTKNTLAWTPPFSIKESFVKTIKTPSTDKL